MVNVDEVIEAYISCALWSSTFDREPDGSLTPCGKDGETVSLMEEYTVEDLAPSTRAAVYRDVVDFVNGCLAERSDVFDGMSDGQIGHDFWLTRNSHGAGFWGRGLGWVGEWLSTMSKPYGSADWYPGDDGKIYQGGDETFVQKS
jgi:hypothetical protein